MINILLTGVGGQGTVLASKILAVAAAAKGWKVRTAETIGMAQRGGSVVSHVRIGDNGEDVHSPLVPIGHADLIIAFEPAEAARVLPYLSKSGTMITATTPVVPSHCSVEGESYSPEEIINNIQLSLYNAMVKNITQGKSRMQRQTQLIAVDDATIVRRIGGNRKVLNTIMLSEAVLHGCTPFSIEELSAALAVCVKPKFLEMNRDVIEAVRESVEAKGPSGNANEA